MFGAVLVKSMNQRLWAQIDAFKKPNGLTKTVAKLQVMCLVKEVGSNRWEVKELKNGSIQFTMTTLVSRYIITVLVV